jgi:hypothetical protein
VACEWFCIFRAPFFNISRPKMVRPIHLPPASGGSPKNASVAPIAGVAANASDVLEFQNVLAAVTFLFCAPVRLPDGARFDSIVHSQFAHAAHQ